METRRGDREPRRVQFDPGGEETETRGAAQQIVHVESTPAPNLLCGHRTEVRVDRRERFCSTRFTEFSRIDRRIELLQLG